MKPRKLRQYVPLTRDEFHRRFFGRFYDPAFDDVQPELEKIFEKRHRDPASSSRILLISGATRSEHTCRGETSNSWRLAEHARKTLEAQAGFEVDVLDGAVPLAVQLLSESRHGADQRLDERALSALGGRARVLIVCPVHWYQAPPSLKLMIDRLVCADGGNPDPTATAGKDPEKAKALELAGWPYPRHLAGRAFAVVAHGDSQGHEDLRRSLTQWLTDIGMSQAGDSAAFDTLIHEKLDQSPEIFTEVSNAAQSLVNRVRALRSGDYVPPDAGLRPPRQK